MKFSDWFVLALQAFVGFVTTVGALNARSGEELGFFVAATIAVMVSSLVLVGAARRREPTRDRAYTRDDELDAHAVLDLDARLEALEQAQADAEDAARWRDLAASGQARGPAEADRPRNSSGGDRTRA